MTILGIGVDVVHLPRILALIRRRTPELLAARILSKPELADWADVRCQDAPAQASFLAVRWGLKEAAYKAVYPHEKPTWKEFSVLRVENRKPFLSYNPRGLSILTSASFHCSVSHDGDYIFSTVIVESS